MEKTLKQINDALEIDRYCCICVKEKSNLFAVQKSRKDVVFWKVTICPPCAKRISAMYYWQKLPANKRKNLYKLAKIVAVEKKRKPQPAY